MGAHGLQGLGCQRLRGSSPYGSPAGLWGSDPRGSVTRVGAQGEPAQTYLTSRPRPFLPGGAPHHTARTPPPAPSKCVSLHHGPHQGTSFPSSACQEAGACSEAALAPFPGEGTEVTTLPPAPEWPAGVRGAPRRASTQVLPPSAWWGQGRGDATRDTQKGIQVPPRTRSPPWSPLLHEGHALRGGGGGGARWSLGGSPGRPPSPQQVRMAAPRQGCLPRRLDHATLGAPWAALTARTWSASRAAARVPLNLWGAPSAPSRRDEGGAGCRLTQDAAAFTVQHSDLHMATGTVGGVPHAPSGLPAPGASFLGAA